MDTIKRWWSRASGRGRAVGLGLGGCALACVAFWSIGFAGLALEQLGPTRTPTASRTYTATITPTTTATSSPTATATRTSTVTVTPTQTATAGPSPTPRPTRTPLPPTPTRTRTRPPATNTRPAPAFTLVEFRDRVPVNGDARVVIQTTAGARCFITYRTPSGNVSEARGLEAQTAGADGRCAWQWQIGRSTNPGQGSVSISVAGYSQTYPIVIE